VAASSLLLLVKQSAVRAVTSCIKLTNGSGRAGVVCRLLNVLWRVQTGLAAIVNTQWHQ